ncbi:MAG: hypothetical protein KBC36_04965 [Spirochaetia bacterium]|nr:hypothetical protein [Spirochaetia bacterium]
MRMAMWRYCISVMRYKEHSFADYFQDIVAQHICVKLNSKYVLLLEEKNGRYQPDIVIKEKKTKEVVSVIEIKTTVGWNRAFITEEEYKNRIIDISQEYSIDPNKVFFILESYGNVNSSFRKEMERMDNKYNGKIYPLFRENAHPSTMFGKGWGEVKASPKEFYYKSIRKRYNEEEIELFDLEGILREKGLA